MKDKQKIHIVPNGGKRTKTTNVIQFNSCSILSQGTARAKRSFKVRGTKTGKGIPKRDEVVTGTANTESGNEEEEEEK